MKTSFNFRFKRGHQYRCPKCGRRGEFRSGHPRADTYIHGKARMGEVSCVVYVPEKELFFKTAQDTIEAVTGYRPTFTGQMFLPFRYGWDKGITTPGNLIRDYLRANLKYSKDLLSRHEGKVKSIDQFLKNGEIISRQGRGQ